MVLRFDTCEIDFDAHAFRRDGEVVPLEPQVFDLLWLFASNPGVLITRDRIIDDIWNGRVVSDAAISSRINAVRRAVGDDGTRQQVLKTVPRRGFRFVAEIEKNRGQAQVDAAARQSIRMTTSHDGTRIAFAVSGVGPTLLRAGHFLTHLERDWSSPVWRPMLDRLATHHQLVRYDQRGTGLSDPDASDLTLDRMVDDLRSVADAAGAAHAPIFAASQGVPVAIAYAATYPDRVSRLVLYGGFCTGRRVGASGDDLARADAILTLLREGWGRQGSAFATAFATLYMPDADQEKISDMTDMQLASATPTMAAALRTAIDAFDVRHLLARVRVPTLVLHMHDDGVQPSDQARQIASGIPDAELRIFEGRNHVPIPGRPEWDALMRATEDFLARDL